MKKYYSILCLAFLSLVFTFLISVTKEEEEEKENESRSIGDFYELQLSRRAGPNGKIEPTDVFKVEQQIKNMGTANYKTNSTNLVWNEMGPDNVGGRTLAILPDNQNPGWLYAGAASGGIWLSKTNGTSWYHITNNSDFYENLCVSSITQTPNGDIYFGTGEGSFGTGTGNLGLVGGGVWRKDKDSTEFRRLSKTNPANGNTSWDYTNFLAASYKRNRIFAGNEGGLYISDDKGANWNLAPGTATGICSEIKSDSDGTIVAIINKKIYVSTNDGDNFFASSSGLPTSGVFNRATIAIASSNTKYIYVVMSSAAAVGCYGAYRTTDRGLTWKLVQMGSPYFNPFGNQGRYDICSAVDPENENHLFVGGLTLWDWKGPGTNFMQISEYGGNQNISTHPDLHNLTIDHRSNPYTLLIGCDGGIYKSNDRAKSFYPASKLYTTTQFYSMSASRNDNVVGGTQDNGTLYIDKNGNSIKAAYDILGGDGFFSETAWNNPYEIKFGESQYGNLNRNQANSTMQHFYDDEALAYIGDANGKFTGNGGNGQFSSPFTLWEHPLYDSIAYFAIGVRGAIFFTKQSKNFAQLGGPKWYKLAAFSGSVNCIEFSKDGDMLFFGVGNAAYRVSGINSAIFDSTFSSNPASHGISFNLLPFYSLGTSVQGITCDLKYKNRLLISTGNYGFTNHVFISYNADDISSNLKFNSVQNNLPSFPCYDAAFDYRDSSTILVGTEYGIYASFNGGKTWSEQNTGLSRVAVYQVRQYIDTRQPWTGSLYYIATYGRGMFKSSSLTTGIQPMAKKEPHAFAVFPNPAINSIAVQGLNEGEVKIYSMEGKCYVSKTITASESIDISALPNGIYIFELTKNGEQNVTKFVKVGSN